MENPPIVYGGGFVHQWKTGCWWWWWDISWLDRVLTFSPTYILYRFKSFVSVTVGQFGHGLIILHRSRWPVQCPKQMAQYETNPDGNRVSWICDTFLYLYTTAPTFLYQNNVLKYLQMFFFNILNLPWTIHWRLSAGILCSSSRSLPSWKTFKTQQTKSQNKN